MNRPQRPGISRESEALNNRLLRLGPRSSSPTTMLDRLRAIDMPNLIQLRRDPARAARLGVSDALLDAEIDCRQALAVRGLA